ncbi:PIG-L deacetylase family protein [Pectinatus frisingensis]|uniref:PIG-L deacetylase family protein n=1 Tax=Pectinatus frisingensis TaxID=865 RepID=UPI0018C4B178|nr:PIG-L family deacetylase [Pectinatus frisingensis]
MNKKNKVLVVAAHPDDEVLGCGGTMAKHVLDGDEVHVLLMAEGLKSRDSFKENDSSDVALKILHQKSKLASSEIGVKDIKLLNFPDNRMDKLQLLDIVKAIEKEIEVYQPNIIYTHHHGDVNIDHQLTHEAVITACRLMPGQCVKKLLFFEVLSSTEWQISTCKNVFLPNWYVDIKLTFNKKIAALKYYESEMRNYPHSRSYKAVEILSRYRGISVGKELVEAFMLGRNIID